MRPLIDWQELFGFDPYRRIGAPRPQRGNVAQEGVTDGFLPAVGELGIPRDRSALGRPDDRLGVTEAGPARKDRGPDSR